MKLMRALLSGYYGKGNGGDEALLATLLQMLPDRVTPVVLSGDPESTQKRYGVEAYERMSPNTVIKAMRSCDAFIWGGGSLIQDVTSTISPFYYNGLMAIAQKRGMRTVAWAQGIGPIKGGVTRWMSQQNFASCTKISVRDKGSAALLAGWNIPYIIAPDPVWALQSKPAPELQDLPEPRVAVTLRSHPELTAPRLACLTRALVEFQKATGTFIVLLPFQKSEDLAIAQAIQPSLKDVSQILSIEEPEVLKGVFRGVKMAIGMRLHSLIMAASEGCRSFAISYDPKVNRLMEEVGMPGWDLVSLPTDHEAISQTWIDLYSNGAPLLPEKIQSLVDGALLHRDLLKEALI